MNEVGECWGFQFSQCLLRVGSEEEWTEREDPSDASVGRKTSSR